MRTKEDNFKFEREKQEVFDRLYKERGWKCKRITGKQNKFYDCVLLIEERWCNVEEKFRRKEWLDLVVELVQDTKTNDPGWLEYTQADFLMYGMGERIYMISIPLLREFVKRNKDKFDTFESKESEGWGNTLNLKIPWSTILQNEIGKVLK